VPTARPNVSVNAGALQPAGMGSYSREEEGQRRRPRAGEAEKPEFKHFLPLPKPKHLIYIKPTVAVVADVASRNSVGLKVNAGLGSPPLHCQHASQCCDCACGSQRGASKQAGAMACACMHRAALTHAVKLAAGRFPHLFLSSPLRLLAPFLR
jgi:hypothetical protein